jgi:glyoxylase-like metal-dependent hydrolase (beta-lactamase superfamily II)
MGVVGAAAFGAAAMKVEMFNVGWLTAAAGIWRRDDDLDRQVRVPVPAYVIETAAERILIDTGLHPAAVDDPARHYGNADALGLFRLELEQSIGEQIDLATITRVVLTHLHFDHAGGLALLPSSVPIVVQRREWEAGRDAAAIAKNFYLPADYEAAGDMVTLVDGDHDLLGDGSIRLLLTPGHTPGHQSVRVGEGLVLGGDVCHYASGLEDHRFPVFADDFAAQAASADRLRGLRDSGALVLPGHDPAVLKPGPLSLSASRPAAAR